MPTSPLSDEALVQQIKTTADPALLGILVQRYQTTVVQACYRYVKDHDTAQDLSQEVFLRVLIKIHSFDGKAAFSTWLHTIVDNRCIDHLRKDKRALHQDISERIIATLADELEDESEKLTLEKLLAMMEQISGEAKLLLLLKYQEGYSVRQMQQATGLSEAVIKMRLHRAKTKLRQQLRRSSL